MKTSTHKFAHKISFKQLLDQFGSVLRFSGVAVTFILSRLFLSISKKISVTKRISSSLKSLSEKLDTDRPSVISRGDVVELALANLKSKKSRTYITVGGVVVGITTVVLLVSIGYGLQQMVVSRVARLDEMRQIDVYTQSGSKLRITDKSLTDIKGISGVESVLPVISVVGRVSYQKSVSDLAVYGVTTEYLRQSAIQPIKGKIFDSNDLSLVRNLPSNQIKEVAIEPKSPQLGMKISDVEVAIKSDNYLKLRKDSSTKSEIIGYVSKSLDKIKGEEFWGTSYLDEKNNGVAGVDEKGNKLGKWIKINTPVYQKDGNTYTPLLNTDNSQVQSSGYIAKIDVETNLVNPETSVLGDSTSITPTPTTSLQPAISVVKSGWVEIASESAIKESLQINKVEVSSLAKREAVVNRAMLSVLGIKESEAVGKLFGVSFVVTGNLLSDNQQRIESNPVQYKIIGVTPDSRSAQFFVAFIDIRTLGVDNYSQAKVIIKNQNDLPKARRQIEALGYKTRSVIDTVNQINQLFGTLRTFLAILGLVALFVAAVGMFNTLTVSLMERTREIGLMKAMGMRSTEIKELFLAESLIMSGAGGILGILFGVLIGKIIEILLSTFAVFKGAGYINITYTPPLFALGIIILALVVGYATGYYPSRRATKISALNALRYE